VIVLDYDKGIEDIKKIISESDNILSDIVEYLHDNFENYSWIGIYIVEGNDLILGPWKGPQATEHTRIPIGTGICGSAAATGKTEVIPDVNADSRYLSCFVSTKSEIVVPIKKDGRIVGEIDIDSDQKEAFTDDDSIFLEKVAEKIGPFFN
jgi:putative methionine-R-sulfoxide reductase with GAF domain